MVDIHPEHARAVLETLSIGVILVDRNERVSWVNAYTAKLLGVTPESLLGRDIAGLPLPYTLAADATEAVEIRIEGAVLGITQRYDQGEGAVVLVLDRGHALVWFLSAIASGVPGTVAGSGVLSRAAVINRLEAEISRSRRYSNQLSCITVKLHGAPAPDLLAALARGLKGQLRWVDLLGQWQPDILLIILPETDAEAALGLREKLSAAVRPLVEATPYADAVELGTGSWRRGDNAEQLVRRALAAGDDAGDPARCSATR